MNSKRVITSTVLALVILLLAGSLSSLQPARGAPEVQGTFPNGAVVTLQGTPHLFIADAAGVLHWGGDTRALRGKFVDWTIRINVPLATLRTLRVGDPYLTAGLVRDGGPIYLVKWETNETLPRLLHVQCIVDVELFGINEGNYSRFVLERPNWEAMLHENMRLQVSSLQKSELPAADPASARCQTGPTPTPRPIRPQLRLNQDEVAACGPAMGRYGLAVDDVNVNRTVTVALPPSVMNRVNQHRETWLGHVYEGERNAIVQQVAPLMRPPPVSPSEVLATSSPIAIGVVMFTRNVPMPGAAMGVPGTGSGALEANMYVVGVRGGPSPQMMLTACNQSAGDVVTSLQPEMRQMTTRDVVPPQAILTSGELCYSWDRVQVCMRLSPRDAMTPSERSAMDDVMSDSVQRLAAAGRLNASDINLGATLPDVEGVAAVSRRQGSMLAAPVYAAPDGLGAASQLVGALHVDLEVVIPNTTVRLPPGDYAVRVRGTGSDRVAELTNVANVRHDLPVTSFEVLGNPTHPDVALVNLVFIIPPDQLCFFFEC
jgi:hypothetical protein